MKTYTQSKLKKGGTSSGSDSTTAWISEFGHISASLDIGFFICNGKALNQMISKDISKFKIQWFFKIRSSKCLLWCFKIDFNNSVRLDTTSFEICRLEVVAKLWRIKDSDWPDCQFWERNWPHIKCSLLTWLNLISNSVSLNCQMIFFSHEISGKSYTFSFERNKQSL